MQFVEWASKAGSFLILFKDRSKPVCTLPALVSCQGDSLMLCTSLQSIVMVTATKHTSLYVLGYVEHTRGEPSLRASVYIISHHTCYISTNVHRYVKQHSHQTIAWQEFSAHTLANLWNLLRSRKFDACQLFQCLSQLHCHFELFNSPD